MKYIRMVVVEDQEFGGLGLKFKDQKKFCNGMFTARDGIIVAHDIIEHQQGVQKIGTIGDEMIALGGICYTRAQWGEMQRKNPNIYTPEENLAFELGHMGQLFFEERVPFRQKLVKTRNSCETLTSIIDNTIEIARDSFSDSFYEEYIVLPADRDHYLECCRQYMLHGAKLAERRFGSGLKANNMFWNIEEAVNETISQIDFEYQEFILGYSEYRATMREYNEQDTY